MVYCFKLKIEKESSELTLLEDDTLVAVRHWPEERGSGGSILRAIDEILTERNMRPEMIEHFTIDANIPETYTSQRIAKTIAIAYGFAVRELRKKEHKAEP